MDPEVTEAVMDCLEEILAKRNRKLNDDKPEKVVEVVYYCLVIFQSIYKDLKDKLKKTLTFNETLTVNCTCKILSDAHYHCVVSANPEDTMWKIQNMVKRHAPHSDNKVKILFLNLKYFY